MIPILILAAGASNRMEGRDKLLMDVGGMPLLRHVAGRALATGHPVIVSLPLGNTTRRAALDGQAVQIVEVSGADQGMATSLRAGLEALPADAVAVLIALADMPEITIDDYQSLINSFKSDPDANIHRASGGDSRAGNPVLLPRWAIQDMGAFRGDKGARDLLRKHPDKVRLVPLPDNHALTDLDTPDDWALWREE